MGQIRRSSVASSHKTFSLIHREAQFQWEICIAEGEEWTLNNLGIFQKLHVTYPSKMKKCRFLDHHFKSKLKLYYTNRLYLNKLIFFSRYDTGLYLQIATLFMVYLCARKVTEIITCLSSVNSRFQRFVSAKSHHQKS